MLRLQHLDEPPTSHDEPPTSHDELRHEGDLAARGRAAKELLDVDVIDYIRLH